MLDWDVDADGVRETSARTDRIQHLPLLIATGLATCFFGFGAAAILNLYLLSIRSPLVLDFRSSLSYKSAILGDGILLPLLNMFVVSFLLRHKQYFSRSLGIAAVALGALVTVYFHVDQAMSGLVNWAMPRPWHWNLLGAWHAVYMLAVSSLLSLFYLVFLRNSVKDRRVIGDFLLVTLGIAIFFVLLRLDYFTVDLRSVFLHG